MKHDVHQNVKAFQKCFVLKPKTSKKTPPLNNMQVHTTSVHASTRCTPFEIMYGRKAKLPTDLRPAEYGTVLPLTYFD